MADLLDLLALLATIAVGVIGYAALLLAEEEGGWTVGRYSDWPALFDPRRYNWIDFTFIHASIERVSLLDEISESGRGWDIHVAFLGFGLFLSNVYDYAEARRQRSIIDA